ncbi:TonB-dependent receptor [Asticcacaulis benevestitus]|nr:TonB-dependent receptor [Asticcacaulis benevestitus]
MALSTAHAAEAPAPTSGEVIDEVVITGKKRSKLLAEKREDIGTSSLISGEDMRRIPSANVVDTLSRLPGVTAYSDMGQGMAATGEKEYLTLRGLDSSYNAYQLNGVTVAQADPSTRALSLKMLAPYGLSSVKVIKTPGAQDEGAAIGGILDLRTPSAFDYNASLNKLTISGTMSQLAKDRGADYAGGNIQYELARKFGNSSQFGFYGALYYDQRSSAGEALEAADYSPTLESEKDISDWTKLTGGLTARNVKYDYYENKTTRSGGNFSLDYRAEGQTAYLRGSLGQYEAEGSDTQHSVLTGLVQRYANGRYAGIGVMPGSYYQIRDQKDSLWTLQAGGATTRDKWTWDYDVNYSFGKITNPNYVEGSLYGMPSVTGAAVITLSDPEHPTVAFNSQATHDYMYSQSTDRLWKFQGHDGYSDSAVTGAKANLTYKVENGAFDTLKAGISFSQNKRSQYDHAFMHDGDNFVILGPDGRKREYYEGAGPTVANMPGRNVGGAFDGAYDGLFRIYDRATFVNGIVPYKYTSQFAKDASGATVGNPGAYDATDFNEKTVNVEEAIAATYVQALLKWDQVEIVPGLRYEHTKFSESHWQKQPDRSGTFVSSETSYDNVLPSVLATLRPADSDWVYRASVRKSFQRPSFGALASPETVTRDDVTGKVIAISKGNPNLKPTEAINYDASAEFYGDAGSLFEVNGFYKDMTNYIYNTAVTGGSAVLPYADQAGPDGIIYSQPQNGQKANIYGVEINGQYRLENLTTTLNGFSLGGNVTAMKSEATSADGRKTWLPRAPELQYNVSLYYDRGAWSSTLIYQHVSEQLLSLRDTKLDTYLQPYQTVDFGLNYRFSHMNIGLSAKNLLDDVSFYKTTGKSKTYLGTQDGGGNGSYVKTGRVITLTASYAW